MVRSQFLKITRQDLIIGVEKQTMAFNLKARLDFKTKTRARMGVWEAMEMLNTLVDDSDPDVTRFALLI